MFGKFEIIKKCSTTNARVSSLQLSNSSLSLPIFMPVGTYGAMKAVTVDNIKENMILSNTYHLRNLGKNIKNFMKYKQNMLTDSGGFQIGSLPDVVVEEEGVKFFDKMFTPEESMDIQITLGADIIMQLDEVVNPNDDIEKIEVASKRSIRWLDRCIKQVYYNKLDEEENINKDNNKLDVKDNNKLDVKDRNKLDVKDNNISNDKNTVDLKDNIENNTKRLKRDNDLIIKLDKSSKQILFPIVTGGLSEELRQYSIDEILKRKPKGLAIGGLSGGEEKSEFARTVLYCTNNLPDNIPRYIMGVGYPEDIVVCVSLGTDMSDCVYPTRTARFGRLFSDKGDILINNKLQYEINKNEECGCSTCTNYSYAYLSLIKGTTNFCMLATEHNLYYMRNLTKRIREAILEDKYPEFIKEYMNKKYKVIPEWIVEIMKKFNIKL
ncbi:queuine tRNA-ribosyltransferase catalytic subunit 1 (QTRT1) [Vairimorpha necatrix]|uniref:Queuine tRNA-ribosyltransferase catalytic subunit 1 (QTRT1) n=1 Tax=Vairimorpha necatrix TaxID=6039 RepID=A0AAX4JCF4_9MICR